MRVRKRGETTGGKEEVAPSYCFRSILNLALHLKEESEFTGAMA